jgi:hypothetical protein
MLISQFLDGCQIFSPLSAGLGLRRSLGWNAGADCHPLLTSIQHTAGFDESASRIFVALSG